MLLLFTVLSLSVSLLLQPIMSSSVLFQQLMKERFLSSDATPDKSIEIQVVVVGCSLFVCGDCLSIVVTPSGILYHVSVSCCRGGNGQC